MRECRTPGSVRGVPGNRHPYRDCHVDLENDREEECHDLALASLLAPGPQTVEHALLAESLGYDRVWLADSPALWQDIWARMALVAEHTNRVQLGTAVLIPSLRHVVTQAAAIATIADIAPGRLTVGLATGFTGRAALGQHKRLPWAVVKRYVHEVSSTLPSV